MKGPSMRKDLYKARLRGLPTKSSHLQDAVHSSPALVNRQKAVRQSELVDFNAAVNPYGEEKPTRH